LAIVTVTGVVTPTILTSGLMVNTVFEDMAKSAIRHMTARETMAMSTFTVFWLSISWLSTS
jgi:hypothetical protein